VAIAGGVRSEANRSNNLALWVVSPADVQIHCRWHISHGQDGYRGEHPLKFWSRHSVPESLRIGYAPLESRTKPWASESPIEGWFPFEGGERAGCDVLWEVNERPGIERHRRPKQPGRQTTKDAVCQTMCTQRAGEVCLDGLPHRRGIPTTHSVSSGRHW
jgi:hypothetical protein